jgi:hypothetical protein
VSSLDFLLLISCISLSSTVIGTLSLLFGLLFAARYVLHESSYSGLEQEVPTPGLLSTHIAGIEK